jgi:hypothetical protein
MQKYSWAGGFLALVFASSAIAAPEPAISIKSAVGANTSNGSQVFAGRRIITGKGGVVSGNFNWGGVKSFSILPSSSLELSIYGNRSGGARFTQINITGEVLIEVLTVNPATEVKVCFRNRWDQVGCSRLKSSVRIAPMPSGEAIIGVQEGNVTVQDEEEKNAPITVQTGQYSILKENGQFTPAQTISKTKGYRYGVGRSKAIAVFEAQPGWRFCDGYIIFQGAIGTPLCLVDPASPLP